VQFFENEHALLERRAARNKKRTGSATDKKTFKNLFQGLDYDFFRSRHGCFSGNFGSD
jgi:hypothetical protein